MSVSKCYKSIGATRHKPEVTISPLQKTYVLNRLYKRHNIERLPLKINSYVKSSELLKGFGKIKRFQLKYFSWNPVCEPIVRARKKTFEKSVLTYGRQHVSSSLAEFQRESFKNVKALGFCVDSTFAIYRHFSLF